MSQTLASPPVGCNDLQPGRLTVQFSYAYMTYMAQYILLQKVSVKVIIDQAPVTGCVYQTGSYLLSIDHLIYRNSATLIANICTHIID